MNYRLVLSNPSVHVDLPSSDLPKLLELIADPTLRWKPIAIGTAGDLIVPAHIAFIQHMA